MKEDEIMVIEKYEKEINSNISDIWDCITNLENQSWRSNIDHIEIINYHNYIEYYNDGNIECVILNKIENELYEYNLKSKIIEGHVIIELKEKNNNTLIRMTVAIDYKKKQLSFITKNHLNKYIEQYFNELIKTL